MDRSLVDLNGEVISHKKRISNDQYDHSNQMPEEKKGCLCSHPL
jgi:hypothetical protein